MGGKIYADINTTLGHVGNLPFGGSIYERLKALGTIKDNGVRSDPSDEKQVNNSENTPHNVEA